MRSFCEKLHILRNGFVFFFFLLGCTEVAYAAGQEMSVGGGTFLWYVHDIWNTCRNFPDAADRIWCAG